MKKALIFILLLLFASSAQATYVPLGANQLLGSLSSSTPAGQALSVPSCNTASSALSYISGTGLGCNSAIIAASATGNAATVTNGIYNTDTGTVTNLMLAGSISNTKLLNSSITVNGTSISLGASGTVTADAGTLTGATLASGVTASSLTSFGASIALGTPASGVATNLTGTAASLTAGNVTTNANLTGPITSVGNATSIASQTGTGSKFVVDTSPALITPAIGVATGAGLVLTGASANIFSVGAGGSTNPVFNVDSSTSSVATGINIKGAVAGGGVALLATSSAINEAVSIDSKGTGVFNLCATSTGAINIGNNSSGNVWLTTAASNNLTLQTGGANRLKITASQSLFTPATSATAANVRFGFTGASDNTLTGATEAPSAYFNLGQIRQHASNTTITLQRDFRITGSTHSFVTSGGTVTDVAAISIDGYGQAGTNATFTNAYGILIPAQAVVGTVTNAYGISVVAPTGAGTLNQAALFTGDVGYTSGNILINTIGKGISIKSGSNARIGTGTLTAGTVTIANTSVTANTRVFLQDTTSGGLTNVGVLTAVTTAGTGFVVTSTLALDTSTFNWMLVESQ